MICWPGQQSCTVNDWFATIVGGIATGMALFLCVRLRIFLGPRLHARFGNPARRLAWVLIVLLMILIANAALLLLRGWLHAAGAVASSLEYEIVFAVIAGTVGFGLVATRTLMRRSSDHVERSTTEQNSNKS